MQPENFKDSPFDFGFEDLPVTLPLFPLDGVLLLPRGHLPLNVFEPRYVQMVEDALARKDRLIGMVQPKGADKALFENGCAGRIVQFQETEDGRYLITLKGISRFRVVGETNANKPYRIAKAEWNEFKNDLKPAGDLGIDRKHLTELLQMYFVIHDISIDWKLVTAVNDEKLMTCLSMICPFSSSEKQALLEAEDCGKRSTLLINLLEMSIKDVKTSGSKH